MDLVDILLALWNNIISDLPQIAVILATVTAIISKFRKGLKEVVEALDATMDVLSNGATEEEIKKAVAEWKDVADLFKAGKIFSKKK